MSPYPLEPARAAGPMRIVLTTYPSREAALTAVDSVLHAGLAACGTVMPVHSRYWWHDALESADETLVLFKTTPKRVGALFRHIESSHPYEVPEIAEVDVPRADHGYVAYLARTLDRAALDIPPSWHVRRRGARPGRGAPSPARTRGTHRPR